MASYRKASKAQIVKIRTIISKLQYNEVIKESIVENFTKSRTKHCSEMFKTEATRLIKTLEYVKSKNSIKAKSDNQSNEGKQNIVDEIYQEAFKWGIIYGNTDDDKAINRYLIDKFCLEKGTVKKKLEQMTYVELKKTLQQFKAILKSKRNKSNPKTK